jgi:hypothetical protein
MTTTTTWDGFLARVEEIAPGSGYDKGTRLDEMPVFHRLAVTRWLSDAFARPVDVGIVRQLDTLGDAWVWMRDVADAGEQLRQDEPGSGPGAGVTSRVRLRPVIPERDVIPLYEAAFEPANATRWRFRGRTVPIDHFAASLFDGVLAQYMVEMRDTGAMVGLVTAYDENTSGLHCKVAFIRCGQRFPGDAGATFEGVMTFITHIFRTFPFRKVFAEVPEPNIGLYSEGFAEIEGTLREYLFHDGQFVDLHVVSFTREVWQQVSALTTW